MSNPALAFLSLSEELLSFLAANRMASREPLLRAHSLELEDGASARVGADEPELEMLDGVPMRMDYRAFARTGELRPVLRAEDDRMPTRPERLARLKRLLKSPEWHAANARRAATAASVMSNAAGAGAAVVAISPFAGPAAPIVAAVGAGLFAVGVLARAAGRQLDNMALSTAGNPLSARTQRVVAEALAIDQLVSELGERAVGDLPRGAIVTLHDQTAAISETMNEWVRINMTLSRAKVEKQRAALESRMLEAAQEITIVATQLLLVLERHHAAEEARLDVADGGAGPRDDELAGGRVKRQRSPSGSRKRRASKARKASPSKARKASPSKARKPSPSKARKASPSKARKASPSKARK